VCYEGDHFKEKGALPVLRSLVSVFDVGSVVERSSCIEVETFVEKLPTSVATVVETGKIR